MTRSTRSTTAEERAERAIESGRLFEDWGWREFPTLKKNIVAEIHEAVEAECQRNKASIDQAVDAMKIVQTENVKLAELYDHEKERALNEEKISDGPRRTRDEGVVALGRPPLPIYLDSSAYDLFANGKDVEVRQDGPRWAGRNLFPGRRCFISRGYSKANRRAGTVGQVWRQPTIYGLSDAVLGRAKLFVRGPRGLPAIAEPHPRFDPMLQVVAFEVLLDD